MLILGAVFIRNRIEEHKKLINRIPISCYLIQNICDLPLDVAPCSDGIEPNVPRNERFYYDKADGACKIFTFEGCGFGNKNKFVTLDKCQRACVQPN